MTKDDLQEILVLAGLFHKYSSFSDLPFCPESVAGMLLNHINSSSHISIVYKTDDGKIIGAAAARIDSPYYTSVNVAFDSYIYVFFDNRGEGICRQLVGTLSAWAKYKNAKRFYIGSSSGTKTNPAALDGFKKSGDLIMRKF